MIDFEEELKKFEPSMEVEDAEDAIYNRDLTDMMDILQEMLNGSMKTWRSRDMQKKSLIQDFAMISIWERR